MNCDTGPPPSDVLYAEVYDYSTLEAAYEAAFIYLCELPDDAEEWLINLQNHLLWHSYEPGEDPDKDCVVLSAVDLVLKHHGIKLCDTKSVELRQIIDTLTLN